MGKEGGVAALIFLICLLCFGTSSPAGRMVLVFAAQGKQVGQLLANTAAEPAKPNNHIKGNEKTGPERGPQHLNGTTASLRRHIPKQVNGNGKKWCIVKPSTSQEKLDDIIQYCCTQPKVDCKVIQPGGTCYLPPNKISDASVVMNIYYKLNGKHPFNCDFKGSGLIVTQDPSVGKCIYQA